MANTKRSRNWGGARPNSGPEKQTLSAAQVKQMLDAAEARANTEKKTIDDVLLDFIYGAESAPNKLAAIKIYKQYTMVATSEGGEADLTLGPQIFTPEKYPDSEDAPAYSAQH